MHMLRVVRRSLLVSSCVVMSSVFADSGTWTGSAGDGFWSTDLNWSGTSVPSAADVADFDSAAEVTLTGDAPTQVSYINFLSGADVTFNAAGTSSLELTKAATVSASGFNTSEGSKVSLNCPVTAARIDKWGAGELHVANALTTPVLVVGSGTNYFDSGANVSVTGTTGLLIFGNGDPTMCSPTMVADGVRISAKDMYLGYSATWSQFFQQGGEVSLSGNLTIGHVTLDPAHPSGYTISGGTLTAANVFVGSATPGIGQFNIEGGVVNCGNLILAHADSEVNLNGGTLSVSGAITAVAGVKGKVHLGGGNLLVETTTTCPIPLEFDDDAAFTKTGAGTLRFSMGRQSFGAGGIEIADGMLAIAPGTEITGELQKVSIAAKGRLQLDSIRAIITAPLDLTIEEGGMVVFPQGTPSYCRSMIVAHALTYAGQEMPKGAYNSESGFVSGLPAAYVVVPYVWTGEGDGTSWADGRNWDTGTVPPANCTVDLSKAGRIVLNDNVTLRGFVFNAQQVSRKLEITGEGAITINPQYGAEASSVIGPGRTVVLDVDLRRTGEAGIFPAIIGGGTLKVKKGYPILSSSNQAPFTLDVTLDFCGENKLQDWDNWSLSYRILGLYQQEAEGIDKVIFSEGCHFTDITRIFTSPTGFYGGEIFVRGADLSLDNLCIISHNSDAASYPKFHIESGSVTLSGAVNLGTLYTDWPRFNNGGALILDGGTLTTPKILCECNNNDIILNDGVLNLGAGGMARSDDVRSRTFTYKAPLQLGNVRVNALADCTLGLAGVVTAQPTINTSGRTVSVTGALSGSGGFTKAGSGTLLFSGAQTWTGALEIREGTVSFATESTIAARSLFVAENAKFVANGTCGAFDVIRVKSLDDLTLSEPISTQRLIVDGVEVTEGTDLIAVTGTIAENVYEYYTDTVVSDVFAPAANSVIYVAPNVTVTFANLVKPTQFLYKRGSGTAIFTGGITCPSEQPGEVADTQYLVCEEGEMSIDCAVSGCRVWCSGKTVTPVISFGENASLSTRACILDGWSLNGQDLRPNYGRIVQRGGTIDMSTVTYNFYLAGSFGIFRHYNDGGSAEFVQEGGVFKLPTNLTTYLDNVFENTARQQFFTWTINGGSAELPIILGQQVTDDITLNINGGEIKARIRGNSTTYPIHVNLAGGTITAFDQTPMFDETLDVNLTGDVTINQGELGGTLKGTGTIRHAEGTLTFNSSTTSWTGVLAIDAGTVRTEQPITPSRVEIGSEGRFAAPKLASAPDLSIERGGQIVLEGDIVVKSFQFDSMPQTGCVYRPGSRGLTGTGSVTVLSGKIPTMILVR